MLTIAEAQAVEVLFGRYQKLIASHMAELQDLPEKCRGEHLVRLCGEAMQNAHHYPFDKLSRWMGFVQGVLAVKGLVDVDEEREFSRPYLHAVHQGPIPTFAG
ncbi:hypothetical protein RBE51_21155 [Pseudomonas taiwanensis]|uniref:hypothetical protein n=1 Tax=Pseudomonas taiwanensis TaxID=470150 RepID=UPI0028DEE8D4|nr:hypothetical protein [Pseudomonas taiwanensis]MDT8925306.1 hypothetical protein [Pseudomonas taiwanensis]